VENAVDRGATTAEEIHRSIADLPIDVLERADLLEDARWELKKLQDASIGAIYDVVRGVNHQVAKLAGSLLQER